MVNILKILNLFVFVAWLAMPALAQDSMVLVDQQGEWVVFRSTSEPVECGIMSLPTDMEFRRNGKRVRANRGPRRLNIVYMKADLNRPLLSYQSGFPIRTDSTVSLLIDGNSFNLYLDPSGKYSEWAWPTPADDSRVVEAMRKGSRATLTSTSQRGTSVKDTFSLKGVTRGLQLAREACQ